MGDEFYAIIKLVSGEELFSLVCIDDNEGDPVLVLQNPITMKMIHSSKGIHIKVKSWLELSDDDFFIVKPDKIITLTETKDEKIIEIYEDYLQEDNIDVYTPQSKSGKTKPSKRMGYISSVEDARKSLEDVYKLEVEDSKES